MTNTDFLRPGNLLRIKDFEFEDGTTRDKYLFVLSRNAAADYIIFSLTTSKNRFNLSKNSRGCQTYPRISTYFNFPANEVFDGDFYFDVDTFILFNQNIRKVSVAKILAYHQSKIPFSFVHLATLSADDLQKLIDCVLMSIFVPNDLKAKLEDSGGNWS